MLCPLCLKQGKQNPMLQEGSYLKCRTCGHREPDLQAVNEIRLNEIRKIRDELWDKQERLDKLGCPEASELLEDVLTQLTEDINLD